MKEEKPDIIDRLSIRERPDGTPLMHQNWGKLLFMHWRIEEDALRHLIPERLTIDTFDGSAWIAITPFTLWGVRETFLPPIPFLSEFHELNVRTYVHLEGTPGVWFFSLDTNSRAAVWGARTFYHLPYMNAEIDLAQDGNTINYDLVRADEPPAEFHAEWKIGANPRFAKPDTLEFFLTERYCLYAARGEADERLYRARIHHEPWSLQDATLQSLDSTMIESHGIPSPAGEPLLHYAEEIAVDIWPPEEV